MRPISGLLTSLPRPRTLTRALSCTKASTLTSRVAFDDILITPLKPRDYEDFQTFKTIITNENIVFTSSWINRWFGVDRLKKRCDFMSAKLEMLEAGDSEINLPEEVLEAYKRGLSPTQIALNRFFTLGENKDNLRRIYLEMTGRSEETGLGYYKFENGSSELLGGGALAPISEDGKKVDVALHILKPKQGIGSQCLERLLDIAFKERGVEQVWGSSIIDHPGTPTLCAKHGMIIQNITAENGEKMKYYFIDRGMRAASAGKAEEMVRRNPIAASMHYGKGGPDSGKGGR
jgi:hypothetical protein